MMNLVLKCHDVETTKSFYKDVLDFDVYDSANNTCTVMKEGGKIIFSDENIWPGNPKCTGTIYFFLDDVDRYYKSIKDKAIILWPLENTSYGSREFGVKDYDEYHLAFAQNV